MSYLTENLQNLPPNYYIGHEKALTAINDKWVMEVFDVEAAFLNATIYAKCEDTRRSISGRVNILGGMITNWSSKIQSTVALSSTES
jgi:hypothetical protein